MAAAGDGDDAPIAAFAVTKGGVVLKHIFLNALPPDLAMTARGTAGGRGVGEDGSGEEEEEDPPVMVGRHPDCHVLVDHPSVSRFHLELRCRRRQRAINVTDLCSVHGTWVSGRRIPPNTPVDLATGDTLRLGASKREYRLLWLSLREAIEMDDPLYMPSLPEEDKEEPQAKEPSSQLVDGHRGSVDMETHQDTSEQIVSEDFTFLAKVVPSAPPSSDFVHPSFAEEPSLSQFHEKRDGVAGEKLVDKNQISESLGSLIIQELPGTLTNAGISIQSDKKDASNKMFKRSKLKSVKSLRVDTGRSRDRSSTLSHSIQNNEILVCSQSCGTECAACIALFGISEAERTEEKEDLIAEDKVDMNPPASMVTEGSKKERKPESYIPQDPVDAKLQKKLVLSESALPLHFKDDAFTDQEIPQWNGATVHTESELVSDNLIMPELKHDGLNPLNLEGPLSEDDNMDPNMNAESPGNGMLEGTICGNVFDNLDTEGIEEDEEICPLEDDEITPNVSGNIIMERNHRGLQPTISEQLMDSISPLNLDHDNFSENENSMLNTGDQMKPNEPVSENLNPLMPISHLKFKDDILLDMENSVPALGKSEAMSPVRQENLFSDKENVTAPSKVKTNVRKVLGTRIDNSVSAANASNKKKVLGSMVDNSVSAENSSNKKQCSELSSKSEKFHTVDSEVFYSDKENLTPISSAGMKARKCFPKDLSVNLDQDQETFCSDKENLTPLSSAAQKTRDMSENRTQVESAIAKKRVAEKLPFQTLLSNSPLRPASSHGCTCAVARPADIAAGDLVIKLEDKFNNLSCNNQESGSAGQGMKTWTMVANTDNLLDDESRKAIMLLRGLKGTHLFIPRIVIRELDSIKQREGLFRRSNKATTILQWIKECMETGSWWIHVQSSADMFPVTPTPPATPSAQRIDEEIQLSSFNPMAALFSLRGSSLADIVSPRPEDRVLDCALVFARLRSSEKVVVLSNSVTLKIKAMAEGLPCEGAKEFRESLMDPSSRRFMWAASAPRGSAWSCLDASALAENYYNSHHHAMKKRVPAAARPAQAAKGLKLILRHNSLYAQATDAAVNKAPLLASLASV